MIKITFIKFTLLKQVWCHKLIFYIFNVVRWMCGASVGDRVSSSKLKSAVADVIRRRILAWYGHVHRKGDADWVKGCTMMVVVRTVPTGRLKKTWQNCVSEDLQLMCLSVLVCYINVFFFNWPPT